MQDRTEHIVLVGYMFCGKTTIGQKLAVRLGYDFYDTDKEIENKFHYSVSDIFKKFGQEVFRKMERDILKELLDLNNVVIATGGGTPCFFDNMQHIKENAVSVFLDMDVRHILARQRQSKVKRPLLEGKSTEEIESYIRETLNQRLHYYTQADIIIDAFNLTVEKVLERINADYRILHN